MCIMWMSVLPLTCCHVFTLILPKLGGYSCSGSVGRAVSQTEVPPAEEEAVQEVCALLAEEPEGPTAFLESNENGTVFR